RRTGVGAERQLRRRGVAPPGTAVSRRGIAAVAVHRLADRPGTPSADGPGAEGVSALGRADRTAVRSGRLDLASADGNARHASRRIKAKRVYLPSAFRFAFAFSLPWSAARRYQRTASSSSFGTPRPLWYIQPRLFWPQALPCSAAL